MLLYGVTWSIIPKHIQRHDSAALAVGQGKRPLGILPAGAVYEERAHSLRTAANPKFEGGKEEGGAIIKSRPPRCDVYDRGLSGARRVGEESKDPDLMICRTGLPGVCLTPQWNPRCADPSGGAGSDLHGDDVREGRGNNCHGGGGVRAETLPTTSH